MNRPPASVACVSVVPSPYQRDLFLALAATERVDLRVYYLEQTPPDSPWPKPQLASFETILPGFFHHIGSSRLHLNWRLPNFDRFDFVIMNSYLSWTAQWLMRRTLKGRRWAFWGEKLRRQNSRLASRLQRIMTAPISSAGAIAAIGSWATGDYQDRFPGKSVHNIPYHCSLNSFFGIERLPRQTQPFTFLFCGQMIPRKGIDILLQAFANASKTIPSIRLNLVGREAGIQSELNRLPADCRDKIFNHGFHPPADLPSFFAEADAFVLPSRHDGWGVVVNQAAASGLPIICSDQTGASYDLVHDGANGFRVPAASVESLTDAMVRLVKAPGVALKMGRESRAIAKHWTPEAGAEKWLGLIEACVE